MKRLIRLMIVGAMVVSCAGLPELHTAAAPETWQANPACRGNYPLGQWQLVHTIEEVAESMFGMVKEYDGKKNLKAGDLTKAMIAKHGEECTKDDCKAAIRILIDSGRCVYSYFGGSYITLPHKEGAAPE